MSARIDEATASTVRGTRRRKIRAALAGGLVLGVGAAVTLAAWTDTETVAASFGSGTFALESSATGAEGSYVQTRVGTPGNPGNGIELETDLAGSNLSPGDTSYVPFWVRLTAESTSSGELDLTRVIGSALPPIPTTAPTNAVLDLRWQLVQLDAGAECDADGVANGAILGSADNVAGFSAGSGSTVTLEPGEGDAAGEAAALCLAVTAKPTLGQGLNTLVVAMFDAESID